MPIVNSGHNELPEDISGNPLRWQSSATPPQLMIVMPAFNEEACLRKVISEWFQEISGSVTSFLFLVLDDGSEDNTLNIARELQSELGPRLAVMSHANRGHGQTCLIGYRLALEWKIPYVLQLDSDGQCDPQYFFRFWKCREQFDVIYGVRTHRGDGFRRWVASAILRLTLLAACRVWCRDANVPYRLMRTSVLSAILPQIPKEFELANIAVAVLLAKAGAVKHAFIPIRFRERYGGEPTVKFSRFGSKAIELVHQLRKIV